MLLHHERLLRRVCRMSPCTSSKSRTVCLPKLGMPAPTAEYDVKMTIKLNSWFHKGFELVFIGCVAVDVYGSDGSDGFASFWPISSWISAITTPSAPFSTKASTVASPMPLAPPVTMATLSWTSSVFVVLRYNVLNTTKW